MVYTITCHGEFTKITSNISIRPAMADELRRVICYNIPHSQVYKEDEYVDLQLYESNCQWFIQGFIKTTETEISESTRLYVELLIMEKLYEEFNMVRIEDIIDCYIDTDDEFDSVFYGKYEEYDEYEDEEEWKLDEWDITNPESVNKIINIIKQIEEK